MTLALSIPDDPRFESFLSHAVALVDDEIYPSGVIRHGPSYPTGTLHQSYPHHLNLLLQGRGTAVKTDLTFYARLYAGAGLSWRVTPLGEYGGYTSGYNESMFVLALRRYLAYSQDHAWATTPLSNGYSPLRVAQGALSFLYGDRLNGSIRGSDWHDAWDLIAGQGIDYELDPPYRPPGVEAPQANMAFVMAAEALAEFVDHYPVPQAGSVWAESAATWRARADTMRTLTQTRFYNADPDHPFYTRIYLNDVPMFNTWGTAVLDPNIWAVLSGCRTDPDVVDVFYDHGPTWNGSLPKFSTGDGVYLGNESGTDHTINGAAEELCHWPWCEKQFELYLADAKVGRSSRAVADWSGGHAPIRYEETYGIGGNGGAPREVRSANSTWLEWVVEGLFGITVNLDGSLTVNPSMPDDWAEPQSLTFWLGDAPVSVVVSGNQQVGPTEFDLAEAFVDLAQPVSGSAGSDSGAHGSASEVAPAFGSAGSDSGGQGDVTAVAATGWEFDLAEAFVALVADATGHAGSGSGARGDVAEVTPVSGRAGSTSRARGAVGGPQALRPPFSLELSASGGRSLEVAGSDGPTLELAADPGLTLIVSGE